MMRVFLLHSNEPTLERLLPKLEFEAGTTLPAKGKDSWFIINWGAFHPDRGRENEVLQPVKHILLAQSKTRAAAMLERHGMEAGLLKGESETEEPGPWIHEYVVPVFHLQALTLYHRRQFVYTPVKAASTSVYTRISTQTEMEEIGTGQPGYHGVRAMREAVKAIYALGLDYGIVRIGVRSNGTLAVLQLDPVPQLDERLAALFAEQMNRFAGELVPKLSKGIKHTAMLGADPEFVLRNTRGKVEFASNFVGKEGLFGCDAIVLPSFRKVYPLAELRPRPSTDVKQLIANLHRTMQLAARTINDSSLDWLAGGMPVRGFPLGGHIHISGVPLNSALLRTLDNYLALPLILIEDSTTGGRKPKYGFLGDYRRQRHGGFEYRVLPSWVVSPVAAKGVLALAKLIAEHYRELNRRPLDEPELIKAYYEGDKARIRPLLLTLWRDLEQLDGYRALEKYLNPLRRKLMLMKPWNEQNDIRPKWRIPT